MDNAPTVTIIIPAKGQAPYLKPCLESLDRLNLKNREIFIVDDGLSDKARQDIASFNEKIKIISSCGRGPSYARNIAAKESNAEYLAFIDSDCLADKYWLNELLKGFTRFKEAAACGGSQGVPDDATAFEKKVYAFMKKAGFISEYIRGASRGNIVRVKHNASCNVMYKRDIFLKEGGFLEGLWPGEDVELDHRLIKNGYILVFNPKASVLHYKPKTIPAFKLMMYRYGYAQAVMVRRYGVFRKIHILPIISILLLAVLAWSVYTDIYITALFFLAAAIIGFICSGFDIGVSILVLIGTFFWHIGFLNGIFTRKIFFKNDESINC